MEKNYAFKFKSIRKVVIIGPESTGKSTLASSLAKHYNTVWVPEYARQYLDRLNREYEEKDLLEIAKGQLAGEISKEKEANDILFCDTNLLVLKVWGEFKFGFCYPEILKHIEKRKYDLYLLTYVDVPWESDPQREHPNLRDFFYNVYKKELTERNCAFVEIKGEFYERKKAAIEAIDTLVL